MVALAAIQARLAACGSSPRVIAALIAVGASQINIDNKLSMLPKEGYGVSQLPEGPVLPGEVPEEA